MEDDIQEGHQDQEHEDHAQSHSPKTANLSFFKLHSQHSFLHSDSKERDEDDQHKHKDKDKQRGSQFRLNLKHSHSSRYFRPVYKYQISSSKRQFSEIQCKFSFKGAKLILAVNNSLLANFKLNHAHKFAHKEGSFNNNLAIKLSASPLLNLTSALKLSQLAAQFKLNLSQTQFSSQLKLKAFKKVEDWQVGVASLLSFKKKNFNKRQLNLWLNANGLGLLVRHDFTNTFLRGLLDFSFLQFQAQFKLPSTLSSVGIKVPTGFGQFQLIKNKNYQLKYSKDILGLKTTLKTQLREGCLACPKLTFNKKFGRGSGELELKGQPWGVRVALKQNFNKVKVRCKVNLQKQIRGNIQLQLWD